MVCININKLYTNNEYNRHRLHVVVLIQTILHFFYLNKIIRNEIENNEILFIILGIILIIILICTYYIYTICYDGDGYHRISVSCWE